MPGRAFSARAPAKVNLVLRVGPPRADGFHGIASLLAPLDLCDRVLVRVSPGRPGPVTCRVPGRPDLDGEGNLAARAALAFRARFGVEDRIAIRIQKRIPVTAGLGGGSSDAAAVLRCLARAYRIRDRAALSRLALAVGSDVPFFLEPGAAWAAGRGERLHPARVPPLHLVLLYPVDPAMGVRAADAYRWLDEDRERLGARASTPRIPRGSGGSGGAGHGAPRSSRGSSRGAGHGGPALPELHNDLEAPCLARRPALGEIRAVLVGAGATSAIMSGSGPTVFGVFGSRVAARRAASRIRGTAAGLEVHVARSVQRQPGAAPWRSPRSASFRSRRRSSRPT
ncbi:MAG: 4-diphosphocytidyl-2C-methyl-D-erythritol kinase [Deltaproteobacteria bacterium]|nr:4-diphosphocytidyl-2C-methyl-D-erythritol kinase [Deltaproteobacteria bacterium]